MRYNFKLYFATSLGSHQVLGEGKMTTLVANGEKLVLLNGRRNDKADRQENNHNHSADNGIVTLEPFQR